MSDLRVRFGRAPLRAPVSDAGFFQTHCCIPFSLPPGAPLFIALEDGGELVGAAIGVEQQCRLGVRSPHIALASPPVLENGVSAERAIAALVEALRARSAVEIILDSFDAVGEVPLIGNGVPRAERVEFRVPLRGSASSLLASYDPKKRTSIRRGEKLGWTLRVAHPQEASDLFWRMQTVLAARSGARGGSYHPRRLARTQVSMLTSLDKSAGACLFVADSRAGPLGAALVGWGNLRAYLVMGASTNEGYVQRSSSWLQWRIMSTLLEAGFTEYNLGGVPKAAEETTHPQYGIYRFKSEFCSTPHLCRGAGWRVRRLHLALHEVAGLSRTSFNILKRPQPPTA